ncbi:MAG: hypothetical protein JSV56_12355 [Methanomassiliicoccales archaeon]|nr:MAG: hypothetical protein JSV56_12355 [Methanomassiliicoccales archaeon]
MESQNPHQDEGSQESGQSSYPPPPGYTQPSDQYPAPVQTGYPQKKGGLKGLTDPEKIAKLVAFGLFLLFIGAAILTATLVSRPPDQWDEKYDNDENRNIDQGEYDDYLRDFRNYKTMRAVGLIAGAVLLEIGLMLLVIALLGGGIMNSDMDPYARLGMIIAGSIVLALELFFLAHLMNLPLLLTLNPVGP